MPLTQEARRWSARTEIDLRKCPEKSVANSGGEQARRILAAQVWAPRAVTPEHVLNWPQEVARKSAVEEDSEARARGGAGLAGRGLIQEKPAAMRVTAALVCERLFRQPATFLIKLPRERGSG